MQQYKANAEVITLDGEKAGEIHRVVMDPKTKEVTHLVVQKGLLFKKDKVIPVESVKKATEEHLELMLNKDELDDLPDFEEKHYIPTDEKMDAGYTSASWYFPYPGIAWWNVHPYAGYSMPPYVVKTERNIPPDTIPLEEGAKVVSADGESVGKVERIYTAPADNRVTHFLISEGIFLKEKKLVPTSWVDNVHENEVQLAVASDVVERLPSYATMV